MGSDWGKTNSSRLLVVEDQDSVAETVTSFLTRGGFKVEQARSLAEAREQLHKSNFDLVILDIALPDGDGRGLLPQLQKAGGPAVVIISGRSGEQDRVFTLESGADDYLVKPFSLRELLARVRVVLRRTRAQRAETLDGDGTQEFGPFRLNRRQRSLTHRKKGEIPLTTAEFEVLACLAANPAEVVSRETLTQQALRRPWHPLDRSVDQIIVFLRRKLGENDAMKIITVRGRGYLLRTESD